MNHSRLLFLRRAILRESVKSARANSQPWSSPAPYKIVDNTVQSILCMLYEVGAQFYILQASFFPFNRPFNAASDANNDRQIKCVTYSHSLTACTD